MRNQTCCFTGHRIILPRTIPVLSAQLETTVRSLIGSGIIYFRAGGALGFDTLAAETVLRLRDEFPQIKLNLMLPCHDQTSDWGKKDIARYEDILKRADEYVYAFDGNYLPGCMLERDRLLVDGSSICVAYCRRPMGGSAYTVRYARKQGLKLIMLGQE